MSVPTQTEGENIPEPVQLPVFTEEMGAAQVLGVDIPDSHFFCGSPGSVAVQGLCRERPSPFMQGIRCARRMADHPATVPKCLVRISGGYAALSVESFAVVPRDRVPAEAEESSGVVV